VRQARLLLSAPRKLLWMLQNTAATLALPPTQTTGPLHLPQVDVVQESTLVEVGQLRHVLQAILAGLCVVGGPGHEGEPGHEGAAGQVAEA